MTSFLSLNVRGIGNIEKRQKVFQWLKTQSCSFYFLQETHVSANTKLKWEQEWGHISLFIGNSSNSEGVAILINKNVSKDSIVGHNEIVPGRLLALDIQLENKSITLLNVYGPNTENTYLFDKLERYLTDNIDKCFIIAGDLNNFRHRIRGN